MKKIGKLYKIYVESVNHHGYQRKLRTSKIRGQKYTITKRKILMEKIQKYCCNSVKDKVEKYGDKSIKEFFLFFLVLK